METKSLGPVPASDLITMVIPKAKIIQPRPFTNILRIKESMSAKGADKIAVLDNGMICAMGTHEELLQTSDIYRDIYQSQMKEGGK